MEIRKIKKEEVREFKKLNNYAFGKWEMDVPEVEELYYFEPERIYGCFIENKLVSGLINHDYRQVIRGKMKKMGGIGGVSTYPEYRGLGLIRELMKNVFNDMKKENTAVSMLMPFKEGYYEKFGYTGTNSNLIVEIPLESLLHHLKCKTPDEYEELRLPCPEGLDDFLNFFSEIAAEYHGLISLESIDIDVLEKNLKNWLFIFIEKDGEIKAAARYLKKGYSRGFKWVDEGIIKVRDFYWKSIKVRNLLFKYLAKHRDQIVKINFEIPFGKNYYPWLLDTINPVNVKVNKVPWMVRIIDVEEALKEIPVSVEGEILLEVKDDWCNWNNGIYLLTAKKDFLEVKRKDKSANETIIDIRGLSALLYGSLSMDELSSRDLIKCKNTDDRNLLQRWFPPETIFNTTYF